MNPNQTRREVLSLYRDVLRTCRTFYWSNDQGIPWCRVLRESARKEFEQGRNENDPLIIARMLFVGRQCVEETRNKFNNVEEVIRQRIDKTKLR
jgi:hypothetical protein